MKSLHRQLFVNKKLMNIYKSDLHIIHAIINLHVGSGDNKL